MTLHIINREETLKLAEKVFSAKADDVVILIEDATYCAIAELPFSCSVFALEADLKARGLLEKKNSKVKSVDYSGFVKLTEDHKKIISW
jgi:tRNA 2-thiouridine synthesizing protein B